MTTQQKAIVFVLACVLLVVLGIAAKGGIQ